MRKVSGFTLIEVMVVMALAAVLLSLAIPGLRGFLVNAARKEASTSLYSAFQRARSEAVVRNTQVEVCARSDTGDGTPTCGGNSWQLGWVVRVVGSNTLLQVHKPVANFITITSPPASSVRFEANGRLGSPIAGVVMGIGNASGVTGSLRCLRIERSGSVRLDENTSCS